MEVVNVESAQPQPNTLEQNLQLYKSSKPAKYVIEMSHGFARNYSIETGDRLVLNQ